MAGKVGTRAAVARLWRERLARWRQSGISISEFCRREKLSQPSFFQWRKRLAKKADASIALGGEARVPSFLPVQVVTPVDGFPQIEIRWGKVRARVPITIDERALRQLLRVIREETAGC